MSGCTHEPEQPAFHIKQGYDVPAVADHVWYEERSNPERAVEVRAEQTHRPEEALHGQESHIGEEMESEETSSRACKVRHAIITTSKTLDRLYQRRQLTSKQ